MAAPSDAVGLWPDVVVFPGMKILAWIVVYMVSFNVFFEPFMFGQPRLPYGTTSWVASILGASLMVPVCGRVLGWW